MNNSNKLRDFLRSENYIKYCKYCGIEFNAVVKNRQYCSLECSAKARKEKKDYYNETRHLNKYTPISNQKRIKKLVEEKKKQDEELLKAAETLFNRPKLLCRPRMSE